MTGFSDTQAPPRPPSLLSLIEDNTHSTLIKQGAEAKVYKSLLSTVPPTLTLPSSSTHASTSAQQLSPPKPILLKYRFPKHYRHPFLSQSITIQRTVSEVRALVRCAKRGVNVPRVNLVDEKLGIIGLEWIDGKSVRELLGGGDEGDELPSDQIRQDAGHSQPEEILSDEEQCEWHDSSFINLIFQDYRSQFTWPRRYTHVPHRIPTSKDAFRRCHPWRPHN